jgi:hypothetical protein
MLPSTAMRGRAPSVAVVLRPGVRSAPIPTKRHALSGRCGGGWLCQRPAHSNKQHGHHGNTKNNLHFGLLGSTQATITAQKRLRGERRHSCRVTASAIHFEPGLDSIPETRGLFKRI